jgi:hypothetical protein
MTRLSKTARSIAVSLVLLVLIFSFCNPVQAASTPTWRYHLDISYTNVRCINSLSRVVQCPYPPPGTGVTNAQLANELGPRFGRDFPVARGPARWPTIGSQYNLRASWMANAPVKVTNVGDVSRRQTWFTLTALKGHFDGAGSTITFAFYNDGKRAHLVVDAHVVKSRAYFNAINSTGARAVWQAFFLNTIRNICRDQQGRKNCNPNG